MTSQVIMTSTSGKEDVVETCLNWIYEQQVIVDTAEYGRNHKSVQDAISDLTHRQNVIASYQKELDALKWVKSEDRDRLKVAYNNLKELVQKKLNCLETMTDITSLEEYCGNLSVVFDNRAVQMVDLENKKVEPTADVGDQMTGFLSPSSQDCIFATRDNWQWVANLVQCIQIHLKNASAYHQFFHEAEEVGQWMLRDLKKLNDSFDVSDLKGDYADAKRLLQELDEIKRAFNQWQTKTNFMWEQAIKLVPVHLRTKATEEALPCRALCSYKTKQIDMREGEDLLLLDNSQNNMWKVRNARGHEAYVPALCIIIPGPFKEALEAAIKLRLQLMAAWTLSLKRIGKRLIYFMLQVFRQWNEDEIKLIKSVQSPEREELLRILRFIEETLGPHWKEYGGFVTLQERMLSTSLILEEGGEAPADTKKYQGLVVQMGMLEKLMQKYKDLWGNWEVYKVLLETSRQPELMLIVDKWEQLKYVSTAYFKKFFQGSTVEFAEFVHRFWQTGMPFEEFEKNMLDYDLGKCIENGDGEEGSEGMGFDETIVKTTTTNYQSAVPNGSQNGDGSSSKKKHQVVTASEESGTSEEGFLEETIVEEHTSAEMSEVDGSDMHYATERKIAKTEQISSAEGEEKKTFIIKLVVDPRDKSEISLQEAIVMGIINPESGSYVNPETKESIPIPVAMSQGLIIVEFTSTRRTREKTSSVGIITVKTVRDMPKTYKILDVTDLKSAEVLTPEEASKRGILNEAGGKFINSRTYEEMLICDAIEKGYITADSEVDHEEPIIDSKTYAVRAVVDVRHNKVISFQEAVSKGIIDKESGAFYNTKTFEKMYIGDAIIRGFLKARAIEDETQLDIDPKNKMVIEKTKQIKEKVLKPIRVISAMKRAMAAAKLGQK